MLKLKLNKFFILVLLGSSYVHSALPENISELVEESAPAVVNITAKKEVSAGFEIVGVK